MNRYGRMVVGVTALVMGSSGWAAEPQRTKVFVLAGQSNMEGQAVVDLAGEHFNGGKGTLASLLAEPGKADRFRHLRGESGAWSSRDDVSVWFRPGEGDVRRGPLTVGFTAYEGRHHFGPELQFGHVIGDAIDEPVLLIKTAWGGKSLAVDFRPPSSGGVTGPYYTRMIEDIRAALGELSSEYELAGFVWYHGWNDGCDPKVAVPEYENNLVNLIRDVRRDLGAPGLPVVVGELTGPWVDAPGEWGDLERKSVV